MAINRLLTGCRRAAARSGFWRIAAATARTRVHDPPRQQEQQKQHAMAVEEADLAEHVERRTGEDRLHSMPCSPSVPPVTPEKRSASASRQQGQMRASHQAGQAAPLITRKLVTSRAPWRRGRPRSAPEPAR